MTGQDPHPRLRPRPLPQAGEVTDCLTCDTCCLAVPKAGLSPIERQSDFCSSIFVLIRVEGLLFEEALPGDESPGYETAPHK